MPANEILYEDASLRMVARRNVLFAVWSATPGVQQVHSFTRAAEQHARKTPGEHALVSVVVSGVPRFTDGVRDELVRVMKNRAMFTVGTAHLVLLEGLAGTAVRAFLSTVRLLARNPAPTAVCGAKDEALLWLLERLRSTRERWTYSELAEALEQAIEGRTIGVGERPDAGRKRA